MSVAGSVQGRFRGGILAQVRHSCRPASRLHSPLNCPLLQFHRSLRSPLHDHVAVQPTWPRSIWAQPIWAPRNGRRSARDGCGSRRMHYHPAAHHRAQRAGSAVSAAGASTTATATDRPCRALAARCGQRRLPHDAGSYARRGRRIDRASGRVSGKFLHQPQMDLRA